MRNWDDEQLDAMRLVGDPAADEVVARIFEHGDFDECRRVLRELIDHDDPFEADLPDGLSDYLAATATLPEWVEHDRVRRGQQVFERWGVPISVALFCASLPSAYACAKGVRVLAQTARLETDTRRRIMETGQFLVDALGPNGLEPGGKGILAVQRVRLMHAAIRQLILQHQASSDDTDGPPKWDDAWGHPINQEDLAGTLLSFSYTVVEPLPRLGIELPEQDREDYLYVWRVIGHMLGLRDDMTPRDTAESTTLVTAIRRRQYGRSEDGIQMTKSLIGLLDEMTPTHLFDAAIVDLIRLLAGDEAANILGLPPTKRHYGWFAWLKVLIRWTTHDVENNKVLRFLANHLGWAVLRGMLDFEREGEHRTPFDIPDQLADAWQLSASEPPSPTTLAQTRGPR